MIARLGLLLIILSFLPVSTAAAQSEQATCRENATEVAMGEKSLRLRDYLCRTSDGARVRVKMHRLDDMLAHAVLTKTLPDALNPVLGRADVISNPVSATFADLMVQFGEERNFPCRRFRQFAPGQSEVVTGAQNCLQRYQRRTLGGWRVNSVSDEDTFPAAIDFASFIKRNVVPPTYQRVSNASAWRYMTNADLENLTDKIRQTNQLVSPTGASDEINVIQFPKELALFQHVAGGQLPKGFSIIEAEYKEVRCGDGAGWMLKYKPRPMMVELALIENLSREPITISGLKGVKSRTERLRKRRKLGEIKSGQPVHLDGGRFVLEPRGRAIIFQRMSFLVDLQPDFVKLPTFDYGPAEFLRSFNVNGKAINLSDRSHNATLLSMSSGEGSCPYLYSRVRDEWINHGKVLHKAKGALLKQWDDKDFDGFRNSFRLIELEPELAIIDQAVLYVTLISGEKLSLRPNRKALSHTDDQAERILERAVELRLSKIC